MPPLSPPQLFRFAGAHAFFSGFHALFLDAEFVSGHSQFSETFGNPTLSSSEQFRVRTIECWGFVEKEKMDSILKKQEEEAANAGRSVLNQKDTAFMLDLLGKNYSEGMHE